MKVQTRYVEAEIVDAKNRVVIGSIRRAHAWAAWRGYDRNNHCLEIGATEAAARNAVVAEWQRQKEDEG